MAETLHFPASEAAKLEPHLPSSPSVVKSPTRPFLTLTFATSLDSSLSLAPGVRTTLSGPASKAMTHYLRSRHAAILVGVNTAIADDPALNCRIEGTHEDLQRQPRPIVLDPGARWAYNAASKVMRLAEEGKGKAPFIVVCEGVKVPEVRRALLEGLGGKFIFLKPLKKGETRLSWGLILRAIAAEGLGTLMVEGGGNVINSLLEPANNGYVDSVIVTIAPTWLGQGGVVVSPKRVTESATGGVPRAALRVKNVKWHQLGEDMVMCGTLKG